MSDDQYKEFYVRPVARADGIFCSKHCSWLKEKNFNFYCKIFKEDLDQQESDIAPTGAFNFYPEDPKSLRCGECLKQENEQQEPVDKRKEPDALIAAEAKEPNNEFVKSCRAFYDEKGFLSDKQIKALVKLQLAQKRSVPINQTRVYSGGGSGKRIKKRREQIEDQKDLIEDRDEDVYDDAGAYYGKRFYRRSHTGGDELHEIICLPDGSSIWKGSGPCGDLYMDEFGDI